MNISEKGIQLICSFEGFRALPYQDVKGVWTIGYGTTIYPNGLKVTANDVAMTPEQAIVCLKYHVEKLVRPCLNKMAHLGLTQNQIDALYCFIYNVGVAGFEGSTLMKDIKIMSTARNLWDNEILTADFMMWVKSGGSIVGGLVKRRKAEAELFCNNQ